jgi:hypothetical protein
MADLAYDFENFLLDTIDAVVALSSVGAAAIDVPVLLLHWASLPLALCPSDQVILSLFSM